MTPDAASILASLHEERTSAFLYRSMEAVESDSLRAALFAKLRHASERQASLWEERLRALGQPVPEFHPPVRARLVARLLRLLGPRPMLPVLAAMKVRGLSIYRSGPVAPGSADADAAFAAATAPTAETWHRAQQGGGALRAAVFGVNDGLVSNASLIVGVAAAGADPHGVVIAGFSGLLAGSLSMATGEYVSVKTQRELLEHQIALEQHELDTMPEEEIDELAAIYEAKGLSAEAARSVASRLIADPKQGLDTLAREELGLNPSDLVSPVSAALASFASFAAGAVIPLVPFLLPTPQPGLWGSLIAMEAGLLIVGGLMSLFTGRGVLWSAFRMALLGSAAAAATFVIGRLLGVAVAG
ncbi:MAG TPA: VIT1/CCC1 transporter family protein [Nitrospiria bacterium]|nr:VIT1/CCC1 transporter family protein [Nitrospiria bacterium]